MACGTSEHMETAMKAKDRGNKAFRNKDYREALSCYSECLRLVCEEGGDDERHPPSRDSTKMIDEFVGPFTELKQTALCNRAMARLKLGDHAGALEDCDQLFASDNVKALYRGATAAMTLGYVERASDFLKRLEALCPEDADTLQLHRVWTEDHMWKMAEHSIQTQVDFGIRIHNCFRPWCSDSSAFTRMDNTLMELADDDGDADASTALGQLRDMFLLDDNTAELCQRFSRNRGFPIVLSFLTEEYHAEAAALLLVAGGGEEGLSPQGVCRWPQQAIRQLCGRITRNAIKQQPVSSATALRVLSKVVKCPRTCWTIAATPCCWEVIAALQESVSSRRPWLSSTTAQAAAEFIQAVACSGDPWMLVRDTAVAHGVDSISLLLLKAYRASPKFPGTELLPPGTPTPPSDPCEPSHESLPVVYSCLPEESLNPVESQEEVLLFLEYERNKVYNRPLLAVRKALIAALPAVLEHEVNGRPQMVKDEHSSSACVSELSSILQDLHSSSPSTSRPELAMDRACKSFSMQKYAADFMANPGGDVITKLPQNVAGMFDPEGSVEQDSAQSGNMMSAQGGAQKDHVPRAPTHDCGLTLIELCLDAMAQAVCSAKTAGMTPAVVRNSFASLEPLGQYYMSPGVLRRLVSVYSAFATVEAASRILEQSTTAAAAVGRACGNRTSRAASLRQLAAAIEKFSGSDYAWIVEDGGGLHILDNTLRGIKARSKALDDAASTVFQMCAVRSYKYNMKAKMQQIKRDYQYWLPEDMDYISQTKLTQHQMPGNTRAQTGTAKAQLITSTEKKKEGGGTGHTVERGMRDNTDEDGCRQAFDSSPDGATRLARNKWRSETLPDALSWHQTSTDIQVSISVPQATRAKSLTVDIRPSFLGIALDWFGALCGGELYCRVKASEATWTLSSGELTILLPKENTDDLWRALFKGDTEKGHFQVLQEMVASDDVHVNYEDIPLESKVLIEEIRERQAMVCDGKLDLENSFDDFRLALGDN